MYFYASGARLALVYTLFHREGATAGVNIDDLAKPGGLLNQRVEIFDLNSLPEFNNKIGFAMVGL